MDRLQLGYETRKADVDRLRFEYEKHQRTIQALQTTIARLSLERQEMNDLDREWSKSDGYRTDAMYRSFNITDEISACERKISMAEMDLRHTHISLDKAERQLQEALDRKAC